MPVPFERRQELGLVTAFADTVMQAFSSPVALYQGSEIRSLSGPLIFAVVVGFFAQAVSSVYLWMLTTLLDVTALPEPLRQPFSELGNPLALAFQLLLSPFQAALGVLLLAGALHGLLSITGAVRQGFAATAGAVGYSQAPLLLVVLPACGGPIGLIWSILLLVVALVQLQGAGVGRSLFTVLVSLTACCCVGVAIQMALGAAFGFLSALVR